MKQCIKYVYEQLWFPITLMFIAIVYAILGVDSQICFGFFSQYIRFGCYGTVVGIAAMFLGAALPRDFDYDRFPFKPYSWEKEGKFYQQVFKINVWKDVVFDVGKANVGMTKKTARGRGNAEGIMILIQETCVAEITHFCLILLSPFMLFFLSGFWKLFFLLLYFLINVLFMMIQRYNRPRLLRLYQKYTKKEQKNAKKI